MFDIPAIYRSLSAVKFTKFFTVSDCNVLLIFSFFIQLVTALDRLGIYLTASQPKALTVGFFLLFN